ncbi:DUF885 domain-containing protein [Saccharopolyspora erythraea]|uniref:DUF885 domain-containing protein n=1 Tax=Saccharopolyspora erythraea TaxID=1836 RepID=UPI001BAAF1E6|nr:DUF885 domain-containing protein [Saccharopolyspora erythraea]QUH00362.1 DUF885 domain-containing protein [Saccharopolyspora erythraea]
MTTASQLADELLDIIFDRDPVRATLAGNRDRDESLPALDPDGESALRSRLVAVRDRAAAQPPTPAHLRDHATAQRRAEPPAPSASTAARGHSTANTPFTDRLTISVVTQQADALIAQIDAKAPEYAINGSLFAPVAGLLFHLSQVPNADAVQARAFLRRLDGIPAFTDSAAHRHLIGLESGRLPVRRLVIEAVEHLDRHLAAPASDPLLAPEMHGADLEAERVRLLETGVRPALRRYRDVLATEIAPHARPDDEPGLCWLPGGREIYRRLVRVHTTTDRTPLELHETGVAMLAELKGEYAEFGRRALGVSDPAEIVRLLRRDPPRRWRDGPELLQAAREAIARAESVAPEWFGRLPAKRCEVQAVHESSGSSTPPAFYVPPSLDGSRPGTYFAATDRAEQRSRHTAEVIAFHEGVPGHHMQLSLAQELGDLPMLRRLLETPACVEGWALYTERLAGEMGLYSDDLQRLGMVSEDALRAARLVVDTGLHEFGWSRRQAVEHMLEHTTLTPLEVEDEVDRYIVLPGQPLSYMTGRLEIERIRDEARRRLGGRFDIRAFHDAVLGHGALPLSTLDWAMGELL